MSRAEPFSTTSHDPRADGARRIVHVSATRVTIERLLDGMRMRIAVPTTAYRDIVIAVRGPGGRATLLLRHDDRDLDVILAEGDALDIARAAKDWATESGRPIVVERAFVAIGAMIARRTKRAEPTRRSRFSRRRKIGVGARQATSFAHEHEIIARR